MKNRLVNTHKMPRKVIFDDIVYYVGKNAKDNWNLIQSADDSDIWIHLQDHPSPHVVIENVSRLDSHHIIYGCHLCKQYSKANKSRVNIFVLEMEYVKKGKVIGEAKLLKTPRTVKL